MIRMFRTVKHIVNNNIWILRYISKYCPQMYFDRIIKILIDVCVTIINLNLTRWVFSGLDDNKRFWNMFFVIFGIAFFYIASNLYHGYISVVWMPQKEIFLDAKVREEYIYKVSKIDQIIFQCSDFFDTYTKGLNEIPRIIKVLNTVTLAVSSLLGLIITCIITSQIHALYLCLGLCAVVIDFIFGLQRNKHNYNRNNACIPDGRKRGYIYRITYQPEFSLDLKTYPHLLELFLCMLRKSTENVLGIFKTFSRKILLVDQIQQISSVVFKTFLPWLLIITLLYENKVTIPEATVLISSAMILPQKLSSFINCFKDISQHSLYIENMRHFMSYEEYIENSGSEKFNPNEPLHIIADNISFDYTENTAAINNLSLEINDGEKIAIVGYNGAGKSTLVKLLMRIYDPSAGFISINNVNIKDYDASSLRSSIAYLRQDFKIYSCSIAENILMHPIEGVEHENIVNEALKKVGLFEKVQKWEKGIHTNITRELDESGEYLSGGEQQKLAIARIYAGKYKCIILDEPTASLDPISEDNIINLIYTIFSDKTLIMISHRLGIIKYSDKVYFMADGQIQASGTHKELMQISEDYNKFYSSQVNKYI